MEYSQDIKKPIILDSGIYQGRKYAIVNLGTHPTAYVSLTEDEENFSTDYNDYGCINVHGDFTYCDTSYWNDDDSIYIGWDYAHCCDYCSYYEKANTPLRNNKKWTTQEILEDVHYVINQMDNCEIIAEENNK